MNICMHNYALEVHTVLCIHIEHITNSFSKIPLSFTLLMKQIFQLVVGKVWSKNELEIPEKYRLYHTRYLNIFADIVSFPLAY